MAARRRRRVGIAQGLGLLAGMAALAAGGVALGVELERRLVNRQIADQPREDPEPFFQLHSDGPLVTTPDGVVLHTEIEEAPAARPTDPTLVFIHGYALNMDCWHFQRKHFRGRLRQVFYDQRSHGRSTRSEPERCRIPQLAEDLAQILDEVAGPGAVPIHSGTPPEPPGSVILIGHSMGGMTIMRLAQTQPERFGSQIRGVALFMTAAGDMADYSPIRGLPGRTFSRIAEPLMATLNRVPELVAQSRKAGSDLGYVVTKRLAFGSDVPPSYVDFASEMIAQTRLEVVADFYPAFADVNEYEALAGLSKLPVAVVGGVDDMITPIAHTDRIVELLPDAEAIKLPACGHLGMIEYAAECNAVLDRLVARAG
jgi:pimeloyl-ACP methyl ester carboxylesterase